MGVDYSLPGIVRVLIREIEDAASDTSVSAKVRFGLLLLLLLLLLLCNCKDALSPGSGGTYGSSSPYIQEGVVLRAFTDAVLIVI
jgi:hypothetical protein